MKFTLAYTLLFLYVIAAILFWGYSLDKQAGIVAQLEIQKLTMKKSNLTPTQFEQERKKINQKRYNRTKQYAGEGATFLLIIMLVAGIVYYAYYRQLRLSQLQQNFMLSVTHELKTPIAGIKLNMQTLERRQQLDEPTKQTLIKMSVEETNRLSDLCNNILVATRLSHTKKVLYAEEINLIALLQHEIQAIQSRFPELIIQTSYATSNLTIKGESTLWHLVFSNLIENARKYTPANEPISIAVTQSATQTIIAIKDNGPGIPEHEKKKIFQKFYRIGDENTRNSKGTGLGLYIVKKIVSMYKYDITVKNNSPKGSIFEIAIS